MFYVKKRKTKGLLLDLDNVNVAWVVGTIRGGGDTQTLSIST